VNRATDYAWFIGCGVALVAYRLLAPRLGITVSQVDGATVPVVTG
jgi:hypothetical protein